MLEPMGLLLSYVALRLTGLGSGNGVPFFLASATSCSSCVQRSSRCCAISARVFGLFMVWAFLGVEVGESLFVESLLSSLFLGVEKLTELLRCCLVGAHSKVESHGPVQGRVELEEDKPLLASQCLWEVVAGKLLKFLESHYVVKV